jgi:acetyl-CoA carboxylase carboxyltransferase component
VVKEALGEEVTKEELGGPAVAIGSGLIHNVAADDVAVLQEIRTYLSYFPSSAWSYPPSAPTADHGPRLLDEILELIPRDNASLYDVRPVVSLLVDGGRFFQIQPDFGPAIVCALAHLGGEPVAIVANQPQVIAGSIDSDAADKAAHFIQVADSFHLPLVLLADNPGVLAGTVSERAAILRAGARMFAAQTQARTIKLQVTMRKAYGFGSMVMGMVGFDHQTSTFAFPGATMGAMGAKGSSAAVGADAERAAEIRTAELQASYNSARTLGFDEMIDPRELRNALLRSLRLGLNRRQSAAEPTARFAISP